MTPLDLSHRLQLLLTPTYHPDISVYLSLLKNSVELQEFRAAVFVFDQIKATSSVIPEEAYQVLERLHSKTLPESSRVTVPVLDPSAKTLAPRRRIHKIIKGWKLKQTNQVATVFIPKVKGFLECHSDLKTIPRIKLAKKIASGCHLDFETSRRIITKLRQTGYLPKETHDPGSNKPNYNWDQHQNEVASNPPTHPPVQRPVLPAKYNGNLGKNTKPMFQSSLDKFFG